MLDLINKIKNVFQNVIGTPAEFVIQAPDRVNLIGEHCGVRMTDGGFGGCVVSFIPNDLVERVRKAVEDKYPAISGLIPSIFVCTAEEGASATNIT